MLKLLLIKNRVGHEVSAVFGTITSVASTDLPRRPGMRMSIGFARVSLALARPAHAHLESAARWIDENAVRVCAEEEEIRVVVESGGDFTNRCRGRSRWRLRTHKTPGNNHSLHTPG